MGNILLSTSAYEVDTGGGLGILKKHFFLKITLLQMSILRTYL